MNLCALSKTAASVGSQPGAACTRATWHEWARRWHDRDSRPMSVPAQAFGDKGGAVVGPDNAGGKRLPGGIQGYQAVHGGAKAEQGRLRGDQRRLIRVLMALGDGLLTISEAGSCLLQAGLRMLHAVSDSMLGHAGLLGCRRRRQLLRRWCRCRRRGNSSCGIKDRGLALTATTAA